MPHLQKQGLRGPMPVPQSLSGTYSGRRASAPPKKMTVPRLYRSPAEPVHWFVWTEDLGWFLFPAKLNGWAERYPAKNVSRQRLQRVPLRMAFNTGLIEAFESHTVHGADPLNRMVAA